MADVRRFKSGFLGAITQQPVSRCQIWTTSPFLPNFFYLSNYSANVKIHFINKKYTSTWEDYELNFIRCRQLGYLQNALEH